jgi:D-threonine aldolase
VTDLVAEARRTGRGPGPAGYGRHVSADPPRSTHDLSTPLLAVEEDVFSHNLATMSAALPGPRLRPHVKAFKSTALAGRLAAAGHRNFTGATVRELEGMAAAGLGDDLLLANEVLDVAGLQRLARADARVTVAVDSDETVAAAAMAGIAEVLIDVYVGLPRCGCDATDAGRLADAARAGGMTVRGVMGYEGHLMMVTDPDKKASKVEAAMAMLLQAHADVGGDVISGGGTGTYDLNQWVTEVQAGSFTLMDRDYARLGQPFRQALFVESTVISVNRAGGWAVADAGLKALGMDHGDPGWADGEVWFCSDEHTTLRGEAAQELQVGDRVRLVPGHVDPTVAKHERMWLVHGDEVVDEWPVDLRHW